MIILISMVNGIMSAQVVPRLLIGLALQVQGRLQFKKEQISWALTHA